MSTSPIIPLHPKIAPSQGTTWPNPLPTLLQTPSGLALLELQGTINHPKPDDENWVTSTEANGGATLQETLIGRLVFPEYDAQNPNNTAWIKRVHLYVGQHQRLTGEVKKLPKAIAIIRKRVDGVEGLRSRDTTIETEGESLGELEIVEIVKWKIIFSQRPEPVGTLAGGV